MLRPARVRAVVIAIVFLCASGCCSSCGCGSVAPQAGGPTPYARCAMMDPPAAREARVGELTLRIAERELEIAGLPEAFPIAIARGAAPSREPIAPALDAIEEQGARALIVVGGLGDDPESATASAEALAGLGRPVLVLQGGRDDPNVVAQALAGRESVIDVSALRRVRLGPVVLVPVAGAPGGRYARSDAACGIGEDDLEAIAGEVGEAEAPVVLLSWAAPAGIAASVGIEGAEAGDAWVSHLATAIGARHGIHAWPEAHAGELLEGHAIAAPIAGPATLRADGSTAVGIRVVQVSAAGLE